MSLGFDSRIVENFLYLKEATTKNDDKDFRYILSAVATDIIFLIKQNPDSPKSEANNFLHSISSSIMDYINQEYKRNVTLNDVAEHFFMSVSSISHVFKEDFGISVKRYITERRMNEIHTRLKNGQKPQEISEEFGFINYSTFYRSYRKHFGVSPSQTYRERK